jgi:nicotinamide-nucleotide amidase
VSGGPDADVHDVDPPDPDEAEPDQADRLAGEVDRLAGEVVRRAVAAGATLATAESLTAGMVCSALGAVPGVSAVLRGGVVAYTLGAKQALLGVDPEVLARHGAVSEPVARQMVAGARRALGADVAVATTGVAGPGPAEGVPAGTVHLAAQRGDAPAVVRRLELPGGRQQVRAATTAAALAMLLELLPATSAP